MPKAVFCKPISLPLGYHNVKIKQRLCGLYVVNANTAWAVRKSHIATTPTRRREIHGSSARPSLSSGADNFPLAATPQSADRTLPVTEPSVDSAPMSPAKPAAPLSILPLSTVLRNLATASISSSPLLLPPSLAIMSSLAHTDRSLLNPDKNPFLRWFLKKTFYRQFCAGENGAEVRQTVDGLKKIGFTGVILGYAKEVVLTEAQTRALESSSTTFDAVEEERARIEISEWAEGTLETVRLAQPGDFVALKFSGAGRQALYTLSHQRPPVPLLATKIDEICALAVERDVPLLFDAEQTAIQAGIDDWTLHYQRKYNTVPGHAIIYGTYQAYLKATPSVLTSHLRTAVRENFTLGAKLVRGAYLGSDPRHVIHDTKDATDAAYNGIAASLVQRRWGSYLKAEEIESGGEEEVRFPSVSIVLGSHNLETVRRARALRDATVAESLKEKKNKSQKAAAALPELAIAQLQGMADEVSCELLCATRSCAGFVDAAGEVPRAYKYLVWGTTRECMKYLLRRAQENRDAVARTRTGRDAMAGEVVRRVRAVFGLA